ncbi:MAG: response regulator [Desulfobacterales bacterium]|nr:response regulator [Desulfobacterales bacterium]
MSKLLLIDDEEGIRTLLGISLESDGYDVITAADGDEGLKLFQKDPFPIVLTDIKMPGLDGLEVLRRIKELNPETEVIVISGHGDMETAVQSLHLGASDFITKPVSDRLLAIALERAEGRLKTKRMLNKYANQLWNMVKEKTKEITRRYEFEEKLIQQSIDGIIATDREGKIIVFNPAAEKIFGYTEDEAKSGKKAYDLYPEGMIQKLPGIFAEKREERDDILGGKDTTILARNGQEIPVRFSGAILREGDRAIGSVGFFQDQRELRRLQAELIKSERLAAVGQTVAGIAHSIKNILNGLKGGVYMVDSAFKVSSAGLPGEQPAGADMADIKRRAQTQLTGGWDMVRRNVDKVSDLVLDLLSYSKEREPHYEKSDPNDIVNEICDLMESKAAENAIELIRDLDATIGKVYLDPPGIHRGLLNLVSNAIDACIFDSDEEKVWHVRLTSRPVDGGGVRFTVADNGSGMDAEVQNKIFTQFFSTKGARGTGLGLLVTQKIMEEHGGTIDVKSEPGKGTRFTIRLPGRESEKEN